VSRRLVVLDAAGTLLAMAGSVGEVYAGEARTLGAELDPRGIERGLAGAMRSAPPLAFGHLAARDRDAAARGWWRAVARAAIAEAGGAPPDFAFDAFFDRVWDRFSRADAWCLYDDVRPALRALRVRGAALAVFSNWDARLPTVLAALGVGGYFCSVVVSLDLPAAKPSRDAFAAVARRLTDATGDGPPPLMVGDRLDHDVLPAMAAGWEAVWLDRGGRGRVPDGVPVVRDLRELAGWTG
jgi:putative hydrolase of the HAD superfamily